MHLVQIISPAPFSNKELSLPLFTGLTLEVSQSLSNSVFIPSCAFQHTDVAMQRLYKEVFAFSWVRQ